MRLSIITINYNSADEIINLLGSLASQTNKDFEIILIDNNSDDVKKLLDYQTSETNIIFIRNNKNLGYSGGNNVGIRKALKNGSLRQAQSKPLQEASEQADWVLLLNPDTWVDNDFMALLRANLRGKKGILGIPIKEGARTAYWGKLKWLKPTLKHSNKQQEIKKKYIIGAAMAVHKDVFEKIGLLDEKYFLYFEDADFSIKAKKNGFPLDIINTIHINHKVSASTKKLGSPLVLRYHYRNALYFNLKNGPWYIKLSVWPWSGIVTIKQVIKIILEINREQSKAVLKGVIDFYRNRMGKIKLAHRPADYNY